MELNGYVERTQQFTAPKNFDTLPTVDRSQQASFGLDMMQRSAQRAQVQPEAPKPLIPIVPIAN